MSSLYLIYKEDVTFQTKLGNWPLTLTAFRNSKTKQLIKSTMMNHIIKQIVRFWKRTQEIARVISVIYYERSCLTEPKNIIANFFLTVDH